MEPGDVIGTRYELLEEMASGGMGVVYRARHTLSKRQVALKVLKKQFLGSANAMARFEREASAAAEIGHRGIVDVLDAGICERTGALFIAMELLNGEDLRARMKRDDDPTALIDVIVRALDPLAALHAREFVHRDLKPENIFISRAGDGSEEIKLLDFGIARSADAMTDTQTGTALGTPGYMAPEQVMSARKATPAADVWAIGVMLYEAIAGELPFGGATKHAVMLAATKQDHMPLAEISRDIDPRLSQLVDACLAKDQSERPADASLLRAALAEIDLAVMPRSGSFEAAFADTIESAPPNSRSPLRASSRAQAKTPAIIKPNKSKSRRWLSIVAPATVALAALGSAAWFFVTPRELLPLKLEHTQMKMHTLNPAPSKEGWERVQFGLWSIDIPKKWLRAVQDVNGVKQFAAHGLDATWTVPPRISVTLEPWPWGGGLPAYLEAGTRVANAHGNKLTRVFDEPVGELPGVGVDFIMPSGHRLINRATMVGAYAVRADCVGANVDGERFEKLCFELLDTLWVSP